MRPSWNSLNLMAPSFSRSRHTHRKSTGVTLTPSTPAELSQPLNLIKQFRRQMTRLDLVPRHLSACPRCITGKATLATRVDRWYNFIRVLGPLPGKEQNKCDGVVTSNCSIWFGGG